MSDHEQANRQIPAPTDLSADEVRSLVRAAYEERDVDAIERASRMLYAAWAERIWRSPMSAESEQLRQTREALEQGFAGYLAARREEFGARLSPPSESSDLPGWFEELALGDHPAESGQWSGYVSEQASLEQMKRIVAQRSLFFLREPDPWIYAVPTLRGVAKAGLIDLLLDEYGWGKLEHMHSSVYARMMRALRLDDVRDHYELDAGASCLAAMNHQWMCALGSGRSRQLIGVIYLTEASSPDAMRAYLAGWERLGVSDPDVLEFYELHVEADENHRAVALEEVVLPLCETEGPQAAREIAKGIFDARMLEADFAESELALAARVAV